MTTLLRVLYLVLVALPLAVATCFLIFGYVVAMALIAPIKASTPKRRGEPLEGFKEQFLSRTKDAQTPSEPEHKLKVH